MKTDIKFDEENAPESVKEDNDPTDEEFAKDKDIKPQEFDPNEIEVGGKKVYNVVWRPLVNSKFSEYAPNVSAVWMWKKLVLRGGSRKKSGQEELSYFKGGFGRLARAMANKIKENGLARY